MHYFCTRITALAYGVMVAHQILVLPVKVRILVRQQPSGEIPKVFFSISVFGYGVSTIFIPMNRLTKILICSPLLIICIAGCYSDNAKLKNTIADYELLQHQIVITNIDSIGTITQFHAYDSLAICLELFEAEKAHLIEIQTRHIDSLNSQIASTEKLIKKENSPMMKKAILQSVNSMKYKKEVATRIIDAYVNEPQTTSLRILTDKIDRYRHFDSAIIGFTVKCSFKGKQGLLPEETFNRTYFMRAQNCQEPIFLDTKTDWQIIGNIN